MTPFISNREARCEGRVQQGGVPRCIRLQAQGPARAEIGTGGPERPMPERDRGREHSGGRDNADAIECQREESLEE